MYAWRVLGGNSIHRALIDAAYRRSEIVQRRRLSSAHEAYFSIRFVWLFFLNRIRTPLNQVLGAITGNQVLQAPFLLDHCIEFSICSRTFISDRTFCLVSGTFCFVF